MMIAVPNYTVIELIIIVTNIILTVGIIFWERKKPQSTYAWLLLIWMLPLVGFVFYLFLAQNITWRKIYRYDTPEDLSYHRFMGERTKKNTDNFPPDNKSIIDYFINTREAYYTNNNEISVFYNGKEKFDALFHAIRNAKHSIHIEYYIIKNNQLGQDFVDLLIQRAAEGIEVLLLFDEVGGRYITRKRLKALEKAGGQYGIFFPSKLPINLRINYRDHRKIVVIDGKIGFIGGYNVGDEYLGLNKKMGFWRDTHLMIRGHAVYELQHRFFLDWRTSGHEVALDRDLSANWDLNYPPMTIPEGAQAGIQIVSDGPDEQEEIIKQGYLQLINRAKKHIYIQTPYFIPDDSINEALRIASHSGVKVHLMIPNKPDHIFIYWATLAYVGELIDCGVNVYIYEKGFLHAKSITVDDEICSVGSCNFDIRSFSLNFESNAFVYDAQLAESLRLAFEKDVADSTYYDKDRYESRSRWLRIKESVSRLFAPLL